MQERESQYVLGDYDVAPGTHVLRDLVATGVLRVGEGCTCDGNLVGGRGVMLGARVVVKGDVLSNGPVHLGAGTRVEGQVRSLASPQEPAGVPRAEQMAEMLPSAISATASALLEVAWHAQRRGGEEDDGGWWGLPRDAVDAVVEELRALMARAYRLGNDDVPWSADEVFDLFLQRVVGGVVPLRVTRKGEQYALVTIGVPNAFQERREDAAGWPRATISFLNLVGRAIHPAFRVDLVDEKELLDASADPPRIHAVATLRPRLDAEPQAR